METALHSVTDKFKRHLNLLKPVLELLLRETSANPSASMLRRMLAFRKSLAAFEMSVTQVRRFFHLRGLMNLFRFHDFYDLPKLTRINSVVFSHYGK